jgi:pyruvate dehydrogenase E1 component beta subunit
MSSNTYRGALEIAMREAMEQSDKTMIIGQGVADFKGLFGTTLGLSDRFPSRIIETPLSEDAIAGICIGASLNGMYPINTHIRADFGLLVFNQLINLAAKYRYMFGGLFEVPLMMRMIIGRSWGQGAQHSQSLQSLLAHIPGLVVVMPSSPQTILASYRYAINNHKGPVIMLEHRLMYELEFEDQEFELANPLFGSITIRVGTDVTVVATSVMVVEAKRAAEYLKDFGISVEIIDLHSISHPDKEMILKSIRKTGKLLVADTSWAAYGVSAEINRMVNESDPSILKSPSVSLGMAPAPCPTAKSLEDLYYPDVHDLVESICELHYGETTHSVPIPDKQSMTDFYKHFKGPF